MQRHIGNPPPTARGVRQPRLVVKARKQLPKAFIWEIVESDSRGGTVVVQSSLPTTFQTMEAAYEHGRTIMMHRET